MSEVNTDLTAKIGPLPAWAWGAIVVVGAIVLQRIRASRAAASAPPATANATADPTLSDPTSGVDPSSEFSSNPFTQAAQDFLTSDPTNTAFPATLQNGLPAPLTNAQWAKAAANSIIGSGADPLAVESALSDYVNGNSLSAAEQSIVSQALSLLGSPPEGVIGVTPSNNPVTPAPSPAPAPVPAQPAPSVAPTDAVSQLAAYIAGTGPRPSFFGLLDPSTQAQVMTTRSGYQATVSHLAPSQAAGYAQAVASAFMASGQNSASVTGTPSAGYTVGSPYYALGTQGGYTYHG